MYLPNSVSHPLASRKSQQRRVSPVSFPPRSYVTGQSPVSRCRFARAETQNPGRRQQKKGGKEAKSACDIVGYRKLVPVADRYEM